MCEIIVLVNGKLKTYNYGVGGIYYTGKYNHFSTLRLKFKFYCLDIGLHKRNKNFFNINDAK